MRTKEAQNKCAVYWGSNWIHYTCQNGLSKCHSGNFSVKHAPRFNGVIKIDGDQLRALIKADRYITFHKIAMTQLIKKNCLWYLWKLRYIKKFDSELPQTTSKADFIKRNMGY